MAKRAKKIGANTPADTSSLGSLRKIKGNRTIKERANTFFMMECLWVITPTKIYTKKQSFEILTVFYYLSILINILSIGLL